VYAYRHNKEAVNLFLDMVAQYLFINLCNNNSVTLARSTAPNEKPQPG
jgi:hypothetical protein